jgi:glyoxalase/bleomycin resistance protein/dioxygenase superfamily protein
LKVNKAVPVLFVERVEPTRDFFVRVGFKVSAEVPAASGVGFAILEKDGVEVMAQTRGNENDSPAIQALTRESRRAAIFIEVDNLDAAIAALKGAKVIVERHKTFYESDELTYEEPGGNLVTFAKFA